mmetsp:Transcript_17397/g.39275  ORF Transcript_17397/g.39275 Transcript_17397/m.39275 type:complete len:446 (-) Transcript_17397:670-2007(-)
MVPADVVAVPILPEQLELPGSKIVRPDVPQRRATVARKRIRAVVVLGPPEGGVPVVVELFLRGGFDVQSPVKHPFGPPRSSGSLSARLRPGPVGQARGLPFQFGGRQKDGSGRLLLVVLKKGRQVALPQGPGVLHVPVVAPGGLPVLPVQQAPVHVEPSVAQCRQVSRASRRNSCLPGLPCDPAAGGNRGRSGDLGSVRGEHPPPPLRSLRHVVLQGKVGPVQLGEPSGGQKAAGGRHRHRRRALAVGQQHLLREVGGDQAQDASRALGVAVEDGGVDVALAGDGEGEAGGVVRQVRSVHVGARHDVEEDGGVDPGPVRHVRGGRDGRVAGALGRVVRAEAEQIVAGHAVPHVLGRRTVRSAAGAVSARRVGAAGRGAVVEQNGEGDGDANQRQQRGRVAVLAFGAEHLRVEVVVDVGGRHLAHVEGFARGGVEVVGERRTVRSR